MTDQPDRRSDDESTPDDGQYADREVSGDAPPPPPPPTAEQSTAAAAEHRAAAAEHRAELAEERLDKNRRTSHDDDAAVRNDDQYEDVKRKPTYGLGSLLALIGAAGIAVSVFLSWVSDEFTGSGDTESAVDVPIQFLWDTVPADSDPSLLFVLIPAAALVLIGALIPRARLLAWLGGIVALAVPVLHTISGGRLTSDLGAGQGAFDYIGIGTYVCAIAAVLAIVGVSMLPRKEIRTT